MLKGLFIVMIDGRLEEFYDFNAIPKEIDHVIKFIPTIPPEPHTDEEHEIIEQWGERFKELMEREYASSNKNR